MIKTIIINKYSTFEINDNNITVINNKNKESIIIDYPHEIEYTDKFYNRMQKNKIEYNYIQILSKISKRNNRKKIIEFLYKIFMHSLMCDNYNNNKINIIIDEFYYNSQISVEFESNHLNKEIITNSLKEIKYYLDNIL